MRDEARKDIAHHEYRLNCDQDDLACIVAYEKTAGKGAQLDTRTTIKSQRDGRE